VHSLPSLLIHPHPYRTEGPRGYLLRLAIENQLRISDLANHGILYEPDVLEANGLMPHEELDPELYRHVRRIADVWVNRKQVWNHQHARFCPLCLAEDPHWRAGWELYFHDTCPEHGVWLIDQCASCGTHVRWNRPFMVRCECGSDLRAEIARACPENAAKLSAILLAKLRNEEPVACPEPFTRLDLQQSQQLIRFFGISLLPGAGRKPLKIRQSGAMATSWNLTSIASEILADWPASFHHVLDQIQKDAGERKGLALNTAFGWTYQYLYRGLKGGAFDSVRQAFEEWLTASWKGSFAKRNKRLMKEIMPRLKWMPAKEVRDVLGISMVRLDRLIREGVLVGEEFITKTGRRFCMVRRDQLEFAKQKMADGFDLKSAGAALGLTKRRMLTILKLLFPNATKPVEAPTAPWYVPRSDVEVYIEMAEHLPRVAIPDEGCVALNHILRYWSWSAMDIVGLLEAAKRGELVPLARVDGARGVSGLIFDEQPLKVWHERKNRGLGEWMTVVQFAKSYSLKQEVAYQLVWNGFVEAERLPTVHAGGWQISRSSIGKFYKDYVFATELADRLGMVSIVVRRLLEERSILPVSGPGADGAKKLLYRRTPEIEQFVRDYTDQVGGEFSLTAPN
jgi:hypothetical protein